MTRERFNWIFVGLVVGIAMTALGVTTSQGAEAPAPAAAALPTGQALVDYRHDAFEEMGDAMKLLSQYDGSDKAAMQAAVKLLDDSQNELASWFPKGSGPGEGGITKTRAMAEIWTDWAGFEAKDKALDDALGPLMTASAEGKPDAVKAAFGDVGKACKGCHEAFRAPEK